jgi:hypothetical protein
VRDTTLDGAVQRGTVGSFRIKKATASAREAVACTSNLLTQNLVIIVATLRSSICLVSIVGRIVGVHHIAPVIIGGTVW